MEYIVQSYIRALREAGTPINASIMIAAANGITDAIQPREEDFFC